MRSQPEVVFSVISAICEAMGEAQPMYNLSHSHSKQFNGLVCRSVQQSKCGPCANPTTGSIANLLCEASFFTGGVDLTNYRTNARRHLRLARSNAIRPLSPLPNALCPFV